MIRIFNIEIIKRAINIYSRTLFQNQEIFIGLAVNLEGTSFLNIFTFDNLNKEYFNNSEDVIFAVPKKMYDVFEEKRESNFKVTFSNEFSFLINNRFDDFVIKTILLPEKGKNYGFFYLISKGNFNIDKKDIFLRFISVFEKNIDAIYFNKYTKYTINAFIKNYLTLLQNHSEVLYEHTLRVSDLTGIIGALLGLDEDSLYKLQIASFIHDLGYIWFSEKVLAEYIENVDSKEKDPLISVHLKRLEEMFFGNVLMKPYVDLALNHHENMSGTGYLKKKDLSLEDNVLIIANYIDGEMVLSGKEETKSIIEHMEKNSGRLYDKNVVNAAIEALKIYYTEFDNGKFWGLILQSRTINLRYEGLGEELIELTGVIEKVMGDTLYVNVRTIEQINVGSILKVKITTKDFPLIAKAQVILKNPYGYVIKVIEKRESKKSKLKVFWSFEFLIGHKNEITPILREKLTPVMWNVLKSKMKSARCKVFGAEGIIFTIENENDIFKQDDVIMLYIEEFGEKLFVPATLISKKKLLYHSQYEAKFFELPERLQSAIYRIIFRRQSSIRTVGGVSEIYK
ncbi:HD-GYP domain, c-di-GMP phosphodiesterase class II (or its inactivated variant) [Marinitoga hydrogenitolerans DSM 16785]|uniref:HD-GYP domain, c-di-GMP phosphodiesterase class II (Or its inactivated variant) n=1 Tax=Marinitoga hydrogenitolerans (strain DSM 16785 / JCM 12826 / AT1271) TaxID=1122195 RepID=A0A1M4UIQ8_MARH1|nr:HD domain-containing phosphohydrolase [Marinitoga hydrogenitolerans]SHE56450.1 HD-GYP domain, c-di-GMP phosphodiesterase class II (or its inactivated variant) [Marinitoga hydrogenitolerans DSM 16785]